MMDIKAFHIAEWWKGMRKRGLSSSYLNDILDWLHKFFVEAFELDIIETMPKKWPERESVPDPEVDDWLSEEQQINVLGNLPKHDRPIYDFLFSHRCPSE